MENFLLILWLGAVGATIGSFLNVVIYRLPRGESLVSPPSHCPKCNHKIRIFDNIPIFGWFFLGGKCRDCKQAISFRYPLIESVSCLIVMAFSILLMPVEQTFVRPELPTQQYIEALLAEHALTAPMPQDETVGVVKMEDIGLKPHQAIIQPMAFPQVIMRIVWLSVLHLFLLTIGMIDFDGQALKIRGIALFLIPFLVAAMFWGFVFAVPWFSVWPFEEILVSFSPQRVPDILSKPFFDLLFGATIGILLGLTVAKIVRIHHLPLWLTATTAIGAFLGWQMTVMILLLALLLHATILFVTRRSCTILALVLASFLINIWVLFP